jgi:hypothetical protein
MGHPSVRKLSANTACNNPGSGGVSGQSAQGQETQSAASDADEAAAGPGLDVHFISSLPVKQLSACTAWGDKKLAQIVWAES